MGRFIRYKNNSGVEYYRRSQKMSLLAASLFLFGVSAATPRALQYVFDEPAPAQLQTQTVRAEELEKPKPEEEPKTTETIVDPGLQRIIEQWTARNNKQKWGVSVEVLGEEAKTARYQASERFYPASLYKLLITQTLSEKLPADQWGKRKVYDHRGAHTYLECVDLMLRLSDNPCGEAVGNFLNWRTVDGRLGAIGLTGTKLNSHDQRFTTAADMSLFMRLLHEESILSQQAEQTVMDALLKQKFRDGIPAGSPDCEVYDKIGDLDGYRHDVGLVKCGDVTYSLAIMSKGGSYAQIADLAGAINTYLTQ